MEKFRLSYDREIFIMDDKINSENQAAETSKFLDDLLDMAESVIYAVFIVLLLFTYVLRIATVEGSSMEPTLQNDDRLIVSDIFFDPKPRDIVIIQSEKAHLFADESETEVIETDGLNKRIVKRVIATEGQTVDIDFELGEVYIDGEKLYESYIAELTTRDEGAFDYPVTIPEGYLFVMGDNRMWSKDSRHPEVGLVKEDDVSGHVILRIAPFEKFGFIY